MFLIDNIFQFWSWGCLCFLLEVESLHQWPYAKQWKKKSSKLMCGGNSAKEDRNTRHNKVLGFGPLKDRCRRSIGYQGQVLCPTKFMNLTFPASPCLSSKLWGYPSTVEQQPQNINRNVQVTSYVSQQRVGTT
jgi:hypothetical protein